MTYIGWIRLVLIIMFAVILWDEIVYRAWRSRNPGAQWSHLRGVNGPPINPRYKRISPIKEDDASRRLYSVLGQQVGY